MKPRTTLLAVAAIATIPALLFLARHGIILPEVGECINLIARPADFYRPVASGNVVRNERRYEFAAVHQYPGTYEVRLLIPLRWQAERFRGSKIGLQITAKDVVVVKQTFEVMSWWRQADSQVVLCATYEVPREVPPRRSVRIRIDFDNTIDSKLPRFDEGQVILEVVEAAVG